MMAASPLQTSDACPACESPLSLSGAALRCAGCGARFRRTPDGFLGAFEESQGVEYPEDGAELTAQVEAVSFWFRHRNAVLSTLLERHAPNGTLWDVGGGNGFQALCFQQQGRSVVLVEPGAAGCRTAQKRGVHRIVQATLESLHLPSSSVAAVSLFDVIEHLADPMRVLIECMRVLRPGGRVYVTVPAYGWLWSEEDLYARHQRRYTRSQLEQELRSSGFALEYLGYYFQPLVIPILLARALPYRLAAWRQSHAEPKMNPDEHAPGGTLQRILEAGLSNELAAIKRGRQLKFGSSLLAVAVKA
jgi:ubiquinone/menaquinone biosynthesis C-methylase UbiE